MFLPLVFQTRNSLGQGFLLVSEGHSGTACVCVLPLVLCPQTKEHFLCCTCLVLSRTGNTQELNVCSFVCLVPLLRKHLLVQCLLTEEHSRTECMFLCVSGSFVCLVPLGSGSCRTEHTQELAMCSFVCLVPLVSGSCRTEHTQELAVCSFVCLIPSRTGNTRGLSVCSLSCLVT